MPINPQDAQPLSAQITQDLRRQITAGDFKVGDKLPSLRALADRYAVAELTVHAAIKTLQHEGVLVSVSGRGTFIRALPVTESESQALSGVELTTEVRALREAVEGLRTRLEAVENAQDKQSR